MSILGALDSIGGAGGVSASSSATSAAGGGTIGSFTFNARPKYVWLIAAAAVAAVLILPKLLKR